MKRSAFKDGIAVLSLFTGFMVLVVCFCLYLSGIGFSKLIPLGGAVLDLLPFAYANLAEDYDE